MAKFNIEINLGNGAVPFVSGRRTENMIRLRNIGDSLSSGNMNGTAHTVTIRNSTVAASGTITLASAANNGTVVIGGVTLTGKTSGPTGNQFLVGVSDTADAAALAALINSSTTAGLNGSVTATSALGVVTVTASQAGVIGNAITTTVSGSGYTAGAARLASGAETLLTAHTF